MTRRIVAISVVVALVGGLTLGALGTFGAFGSPPASLQVAGVVVPADASTSHAFTLTPVDGPSRRTVTSDTAVFDDLPAGEYRLEAAAVTGADPGDITCDPAETVASIDVASRSVLLDVARGQELACTFEATKRGEIVVAAKALPADTRRSFRFRPSWGESFRLRPGEKVRATDVIPGEYTVRQRVPTRWDTTESTCSDGSTPRAIDLDPGERVRCVLEAAQRGTITVRKTTEPSASTRRSTFSPSWGKQFSIAGTAEKRSRWLVPDTYSVTEALPRGWDRDSVRCSDGSTPTAIELNAGESVTCSFASQRRGRIAVVIDPPEGVTGKVIVTAPWVKRHRLSASSPAASRVVSPGQHAFAARAPASWHRTSTQCSDGSTPEAVIVDPGETVTCTLTYRQARFDAATFNVLGNSHTGPNGNKPQYAPGSARMATSMRLLQEQGVDVVGLQEFQNPQMADFLRLGGGQFAVYPDPGLAQRNKQNAIAWRTSVFELVEGRPVMIPYFHGNLVPMPLVKLRHRETGAEVYVMTVHNAASTKRTGNQTRWRDAAMRQQIALTATLLDEGVPFIMTGDMNERAKYFCAYTASGTMHAAAGGSNDGRCVPPPSSIARIDWIFGSRDVVFSDYRFRKDAVVQSASDHPLITTTATLLR